MAVTDLLVTMVTVVIQVRIKVVGQGNVLSLWFWDVRRDDLLHIIIYR
jgi:hypothetical protein